MPGATAGTRVKFQQFRIEWLVTDESPLDTPDEHYFNIDNLLVYPTLVYDFGPLDLGMVHWYVMSLHNKLCDPRHDGKAIVHCCSPDEAKSANAAFLVCAYLVVLGSQSPQQAFGAFDDGNIEFTPFRDASRESQSSFGLTILDCLRGLVAGINLGWYQYQTFDLADYVRCHELQRGDMSWIVPGKVLAFSSPMDESREPEACTAEALVPILQSKGVEAVIRLNSRKYDEEIFVRSAIQHFDLLFPDGSCPPAHVINRFCDIADEVGVVAVHCIAGLGRTGTLIGLYAMKRYHLTAVEYIAWSRLCRPGSVIGPQQVFLANMQESIDSEITQAVVEAAQRDRDEGQAPELRHSRRQTASRAPM